MVSTSFPGVGLRTSTGSFIYQASCLPAPPGEPSSGLQPNLHDLLPKDLAHPRRQEPVGRLRKGKHALPVSAVQVQAPGWAYRVRWRPGREGTLLIDILLRVDLADGRYTSTLNLGPAEDPTLISIPLDAEVGPSVSLVHSRVRLVRDQATGTFRPAQVIVVARKPGLLLAPLEPLDWPAGITLKDAMPTRAQMRRVEILVNAAVHLAEAGLTLAVLTAELKEPVVFTLEEHRTLAPAAAMPLGQP